LDYGAGLLDCSGVSVGCGLDPPSGCDPGEKLDVEEFSARDAKEVSRVETTPQERKGSRNF
jgi:hypothetical protein